MTTLRCHHSLLLFNASPAPCDLRFRVAARCSISSSFNKAKPCHTCAPASTKLGNNGITEQSSPRALLLDYLSTLGINNTGELHKIHLPKNIHLLKDRLDFLQKLGLTIQDVNKHPVMLSCTLNHNKILEVFDYLEQLGVNKSAIPQIVERCPPILHTNPFKDLQPVVECLDGLGLSETTLPRFLESFPEVLCFEVEGTMATSVAYLVSIGVNTKALRSMLIGYPAILGLSVGRVIKPFVDYLVKFGMEIQTLARILEKKPYILSFDLEEKVKQNVNCLLEFGVRSDAIACIFTEFPDILGFDLKPQLESKREFFRSYVLVDPPDFGLLLERMPQISVIREDSVLKRIVMLKGWGFSLGDISKMVVKCPHLLVFNREDMELALNFFRNEIRGDLQDLVEFPAYFGYDLESTIKPRLRTIASRGLLCRIPFFLDCTDDIFEERLDADCTKHERKRTEGSNRLAMDARSSSSL